MTDVTLVSACSNEECPLYKDSKTDVVQTGKMGHEGDQLIWRRRRCPKCRETTKTVELPADKAQELYKTPFKGMY